MGSGKGDFCNSISKIKKFDILFRFTNIEKVCVDNILKKIKFKLPIKVGIVVSN
jgi:ribosomal protein L16/L10AE